MLNNCGFKINSNINVGIIANIIIITRIIIINNKNYYYVLAIICTSTSTSMCIHKRIAILFHLDVKAPAMFR